jgi:methionyl-tRNA formyltransferase
MAPRKLKIMVVAEEGAGAQMFRALAATNHEIAAVLTSNTNEPGETSLATIAARQGCQVWNARLVKKASLADDMRKAQVDLLLNVHSRYVVCNEVLAAARIGAFNMHPGPLPRYAGLNAVSWTIFHGEKTHGVTVHWMEPGIDTGPIAYQAMFPILPADTPLTLTHKCVTNGIPLLLELVRAASLDEQSIPRLPQNLAEQRYYGKEVPQQGRLVWNRPARDVADFVRACEYWPYPSPWGHPVTKFQGREFEVMRAARTGKRSDVSPGTVGECSQSECLVAAADEWIAVRQLKCDSRTIRPSEILRPGSLLGAAQA